MMFMDIKWSTMCLVTSGETLSMDTPLCKDVGSACSCCHRCWFCWLLVHADLQVIRKYQRSNHICTCFVYCIYDCLVQMFLQWTGPSTSSVRVSNSRSFNPAYCDKLFRVPLRLRSKLRSVFVCQSQSLYLKPLIKRSTANSAYPVIIL